MEKDLDHVIIGDISKYLINRNQINQRYVELSENWYTKFMLDGTSL